jgi:hypothetical protein
MAHELAVLAVLAVLAGSLPSCYYIVPITAANAV